MRVILETAEHKVTVEVERDDLKVQEVLGLFREAMLGSGFTEESIDRWLPGGPLIDALAEPNQ